MRVDALHRRVSKDVSLMYDAVNKVLTPSMPRRYNEGRMNIRPFVARLNSATLPFNVVTDLLPDPTMKPELLVQSGMWLSADALPENGTDADVRVLWHTHPSTARLTLTPRLWARRRFYYFELLMHELIHRHQDQKDPDHDFRVYRPRTEDVKQIEEQKYYGSVDEIEAYAHNAAMEFATWWPDATLRQCMEMSFDVKGPTPPSYITYYSIFETGHPAYQHFMKKLKSWFAVVHANREFYQSLELAKIV